MQPLTQRLMLAAKPVLVTVGCPIRPPPRFYHRTLLPCIVSGLGVLPWTAKGYAGRVVVDACRHGSLIDRLYINTEKMFGLKTAWKPISMAMPGRSGVRVGSVVGVVFPSLVQEVRWMQPGALRLAALGAGRRAAAGRL